MWVLGTIDVSRWMLVGLSSAALAGCGESRGLVRQAPVDTPVTIERSWSFDDLPADSTPPGWRVAETRSLGTPAVWRVVADESAPSRLNALALIQSDNKGRTFNLAVAEGAAFGDLVLSVEVKAVRGEEDRGGGPVWRYLDANNYYVCRFNPLEGNFRVYKVVSGKRKKLQSAKVDTRAGRWYTVGVRMVGSKITCSIDGTTHLEIEDPTFAEPGKVGFWTKADAVTSFDNLVVSSFSTKAD